VNYKKGMPVNTLCALGAVVAPSYKGKSLSYPILGEMKRLAVQKNLVRMIAPVRPVLKKKYPLIPIEKYVKWTREDGAPFDPWIRVHWRMGAQILRVAPRSMVISGTVSDWESWTGMAFPETGEHVVPDTLQPVRIDKEKDLGQYEDPNVWMEHVL